MSQSLISSLAALFDPADARRIAAGAGVPEDKIQQGFRTAVRSILDGIAEKVHDPAELRRFFDAVATAGSEPGVALDEFGTQGDTGALLSILFGDRRSAIVEEAGKQTSLPSGVMTQLMSRAAPLVTSALGKRLHDRGIALTSVLDAGGPKSEEVSTHLPASPQSVANKPLRRRWKGIALTAIFLLLAVWLLGRATSKETVTVTEAAPEATRSRVLWPELGPMMVRKLPGGVRLRVPEKGMEARLISYIEDPSWRPGTADENAFEFDRLTFDTNSALPSPESGEQLTNVAMILKAYPSVRLEIAGYTDNQGDRRANLRLSENRAAAVRRELVGMGIHTSRLNEAGYGDQPAIAGNATEQGRAKNRRTSLKVLQK